jgi:hypothetical protein
MNDSIGRSAKLPWGSACAALCVAVLFSACAAGDEAEAGAAPREPAAPEVAGPSLVMEENGIRVSGAAGESARELTFGMAEEEVIAAVGFRGEPERGTSPECGAGPLEYASWPDGVGLFFADGEFGGWWLDGRGGDAVTTRAGIGPGSTRGALQAAYDVEIGESTLGMEFFTTGGIGGLLEGPGEEARVTHMWAGLNCVFR